MTWDRKERLSALHDAKNAIRYRYAWPAGRAIYLVMATGKPLSLAIARMNWRIIVLATLYGSFYDPWRVQGARINDDERLYCCQSGELIPSIYEPEDNHGSSL